MKKLLPFFISAALATVSHSALADNLTQIYQQAKQNDPQLLSAAAQKNQAFEAIGEANSALLPQINLTGGYKIGAPINELHNNTHGFNAGVSVGQSIFNRTSWANLDVAQLKAREADAVYAATQQGVILNVAQAYFNVLKAMDDLKFVEAEKKAVGRQLEQTKQRFEVGLSAITDVHDAQAQYDAVLASVIQQQNILANSYEGLSEITGQNYTAVAPLDTSKFKAVKPLHNAQDLLKQAEKDNLTLLAKRIAQDMAREGITVSESQRSPVVTVGAGYGYDGVQNNPAFENRGQVSANISISVPLYTGGRITSQVKQAQYGYVASSENLEQAYRTVTRNVRNDYNNINAAIGSVRAYEQSVISARSALKATEAGFDVGTRTIVDVLDATQSLYNANSQLANARYSYLLSTLQLKQAVGTLNENDLLDINHMLAPSTQTSTER